MYFSPVKSVERFFITQLSTPTAMIDGEELVPPTIASATVIDGEPYFSGQTNPNVRERWEVMSVTNDSMNTSLTWRYTISVLEIDDPGYVVAPNKEPPVVPKQRLFLSLELMATEEITPESVNDWLTRRLQGCPFGYLILNEIKRGPDPTVWGRLTSEEDDFEVPKHLKDEDEGNKDDD